MLNQIWTFIQDQLQNNAFLSGGAVLMVLGALVAYCRQVPGKAYRWCKHRLFFEFEIPSKDEAFWWFDEWLSIHNYTQKHARWLSVRTTNKERSGEPDDSSPVNLKVILSPAPGWHWMFWKRRLLIVYRERKDDDGKETGFTTIQREVFNVAILTRKRDTIIELLEECRRVVMPPGEERVNIYVPHAYHAEWSSGMKRKPRPIESVILKGNMMEELVGDIEQFLASEQWYVERGIPYRRGYMLYGPPGSGKSSTVFALASHLKLDIAILNLNESRLTDNDLRVALATVPAKTVVLIEDIDCVFTKRKEGKEKDNKITFSGLLNAIDGVAASEGRILFMTTNHLDTLDEALIRPGRCDLKLFIDNADYTQAIRLFDRFFPDAPAALSHDFASVAQGASMAALQGHLTKYCNHPEAAVANAGDVHHSIRSSNESKTQDTGTA
jgi:chaperone BCS1